MKSPRSPFAKFEAALAAERRAERRAMNPDAITERRPRKARPAPKFHRVEFQVDPIVTANAALHAVKQGTTTNKVIEGWIKKLALEGKPPDQDAGIKLILQIAVGPHGIPADLAQEISEIARGEGMDPGELCSLFLRVGLHKKKEAKRTEQIR